MNSILLVEDDPHWALTQASRLRGLGYGVQVCPSGAAALTACGQGDIDLILMDIDLGEGMDGIETAGKILTCHDIPLLFVSAHAEPELLARAELVSAYGCLAKDSPITVLKATIKMAFQLHQAHRDLRRSEEKYSKVFHTSPDAISINRLSDGVFLEVNEGFTHLMGYTPEEVLGKSTFTGELQLWAVPGDRDRLLAELQRCGEVTDLVAPYRTKGGIVRTGMTSAKILVLDGQPCLMAVSRDITDRIEMEERLKVSEQGFQAIFDLCADAVLLTTMTGVIVKANQTAHQRLKYPPDALTGQSVAEFHDPDDADFIRSRLRDARERGGFLTETTHKRSDGVKFPVEINARTIEYGGQKLILATVRDISERKKAEDALRETQLRYRMIFENTFTANAIFDTQGKLVLHNQRFLQLLRLSGDVVGKTALELPVPLVAASLQENLDLVVAAKATRTHTAEFAWPEGAQWFQTLYHPIFDQHGVFMGVLVMAQDITENRRMGDMVKNAEKLETIGVLAGGIAHDFNNMLSGLSGYLEMAMLKIQDENTADALMRLEKAINVIHRGKSLTKQLLTFAKGRIPNRELHQLGPLLKEWAVFALSGSEVSLILDVAPDLWSCECDVQLIGQSVDNLLINARQASSAGQSITLQAENAGLDKPHICIRVIDHGPGIPAEVREKIFDPFFTTKATGSGLGLATSLSIVEQHGGWIEVESPPGKGASFALFLPAHIGPHAEKHRGLKGEFRGSGWAVLMDDEPTLREALQEMLESFGYDVLAARDGRDAVAFFSEAQKVGNVVNLVLLDLTVPGGMGGVETAKTLRSLGAGCPIVGMSGYSELTPQVLSVHGQFQGVISKPFSRTELGLFLKGHATVE